MKTIALAELCSSVDTDKLLRAIVGPISEDRHLWRMNWLRSLIDAYDKGEIAPTDKCDDAQAMRECVDECREMWIDLSRATASVAPWSSD